MEIILVQKILNTSSSSEDDESSSSSDEEILILKKYRQSHVKIKNYKDIVNMYSISDFHSHFRMTRTTFEVCLNRYYLKNNTLYFFRN